GPEGPGPRRGVTPSTLLTGTGAFGLDVVDAADSRVLYTVQVPADRFVSHGRTTKYDRAGDFQGRIAFKASHRQADTVPVSVRAPNALLGDSSGVASARAFFPTGASCARPGGPPCTAAGGLRCSRSSQYEPFADQGFGALGRSRLAPRNAFCGLAIEANTACDFLIDERCILPYPSSYFLAPD